MAVRTAHTLCSVCWCAVLLKLKLVLCFRFYKEHEIRFWYEIYGGISVPKIYQNIAWFDKVIAKIKWCSCFYSHGMFN